MSRGLPLHRADHVGGDEVLRVWRGVRAEIRLCRLREEVILVAGCNIRARSLARNLDRNRVLRHRQSIPI